MNSSELATHLQPEIIESFKRAVEIGKWPDGNVLTSEQREVCMQAVIAWEYHNLPEEARTGYVPPKPACATDHHHHDNDHDEEQELKWALNEHDNTIAK